MTTELVLVVPPIVKPAWMMQARNPAKRPSDSVKMYSAKGVPDTFEAMKKHIRFPGMAKT